MDETEITNSKYKAVRILGSRLHYPRTPCRPCFRRKRGVQDRRGSSPRATLCSSSQLEQSYSSGAIPNEDELRAIESVPHTNPITGVRELDAEQLNYRYEVYNHTEAARRRNRLKTRGAGIITIPTTPAPSDVPQIAKGYCMGERGFGEIVRQTISGAVFTGDLRLPEHLYCERVSRYHGLDKTILKTHTTSRMCAHVLRAWRIQ